MNKQIDIEKTLAEIERLKEKQKKLSKALANATRDITCYDTTPNYKELSEEYYAVDFDGNKYTKGTIPTDPESYISGRIKYVDGVMIASILHDGKDRLSPICSAHTMDEMIVMLEMQKRRIDVLIEGCNERKKELE